MASDASSDEEPSGSGAELEEGGELPLVSVGWAGRVGVGKDGEGGSSEGGTDGSGSGSESDEDGDMPGWGSG